MKKAIEVNIGGINFTMEDEAYIVLKDYLKRFEATIADKQEAREVMEDVEARVAEIFQKEKKFSNQVVDQKLVHLVIDMLGEVEMEANADTDFASEEQTDDNGYTKGTKYLYRDMDDKKLSGVCSGLAANWGIDVTIIRVVFILAAFAYGTTVWIYIILWLVVPQARTVADKLKMRGYATTAKNMRKYAFEHKQQNA